MRMIDIAAVRRVLGHAGERAALVCVGLGLLEGVLDLFGLASVVAVLVAASNAASVQVLRDWATPFAPRLAPHAPWLVAAALPLLFALKSLASVAIHRFRTHFIWHLGSDVSARAFAAFLAREPLSVAVGEAEVVHTIRLLPLRFANRLVRNGVQLIVEGAVLLVGSLTLVVATGGLALPLLTALGGLAALPAAWRGKKDASLGADNRRDEVQALHLARQVVRAAVDVKVHGNGAHLLERYRHALQQADARMIALDVVGQVSPRLNEVFAVGAFALAVLWGWLHGTDVVLLVGVMAAAVYRLLPSVNRCVRAWHDIAAHACSAEVLDAWLATYVEPIRAAAESMPITTGVVLRDATYLYDGVHGVRSATIALACGEVVGVTGCSGGGKTTLLRMLLRLVPQHDGALLVDGHDVTTTERWRRSIGYVSQTPLLIDATLAENIAWASEAPDSARLAGAVRDAALESVVTRLEHGLATRLGREGQELSGGELQRVAIARAMYRDPQVYVLDEATSELDADTEARILVALQRRAQRGAIVLMVTHRQAVLDACDRAYVMQDGALRERTEWGSLREGYQIVARDVRASAT